MSRVTVSIFAYTRRNLYYGETVHEGVETIEQLCTCFEVSRSLAFIRTYTKSIIIVARSRGDVVALGRWKI